MSGFISFNTLPYRVLIVEDEVLTRSSLTQILSIYFSEVFDAEDGHIGLEKYHQLKPDIIFSDIVMPTMNGIDMLKEVRRFSGHNPLVVLFSAFDVSVSENDISQINVFKKMEKPFNFKQLEKLIDDIRLHKMAN
jgi:YesN/AraC family two-component response regulator